MKRFVLVFIFIAGLALAGYANDDSVLGEWRGNSENGSSWDTMVFLKDGTGLIKSTKNAPMERFKYRILENNRMEIGESGGALLFLVSGDIITFSNPEDPNDTLFLRRKGSFKPRGKLFKATVTTDEARFVLPIGKQDIWLWNLGSTRAVDKNAFAVGEYNWIVEVENEGNTYWFGFSRMSFKEEPQQSVDLAALIKAGKVTSGASVEPVGEALVIKIKGRENVREFFSSRPKKVTFRIRDPYEDDVFQDVLVTYKK